MVKCCNIVYNSETLINEFHNNNWLFIIDRIPVSFLISKFNVKCLNSLGPNAEDFAKFNNLEAYKEANNDTRNLSLYTKEVELPGISVESSNLAMLSTSDVKVMSGKMRFSELTTVFQVDENFFIPRFMHYWLVAAGNPEEIAKFNQNEHLHNFYTEGNLILLDNNRDKTIEIRFNGLHPTSISPIKLNSSEPGKVDMTVTWIYTSYVFSDEYKIYGQV